MLSEQDPLFWPAAGDDSAYIHKLSVRRRFAGGRVSRQMVAWAHAEAIRLGKTYLRLDCSAERPKLCGFYTSLGFRMVERRMVGPFDEAFFELRLD